MNLAQWKNCCVTMQSKRLCRSPSQSAFKSLSTKHQNPLAPGGGGSSALTTHEKCFQEFLFVAARRGAPAGVALCAGLSAGVARTFHAPLQSLRLAGFVAGVGLERPT